MVMAVRWVMDSPLRGWSRGSVATLWHTSESSEAVESRSSLRRIVGKPPLGQIMARSVEKVMPQLHLVRVFGSFRPYRRQIAT